MTNGQNTSNVGNPLFSYLKHYSLKQVHGITLFIQVISCCILTISYWNSSFVGITNNTMVLDLNSYFLIAIGLDFKLFYFVSKQNKRRIATKQERQTSTNWSPRQNMEVTECIYS